MTVVKGATVSARTALSLMQIGLLTYRDWAKPWSHESELIQRALEKWLRKATGELQMFQFGIAYSDRRDELLESFGHFSEGRNNPQNISFTLYRIGERPLYTLSDGITALETTVAGLGETAMFYIARAQWNTVPMLTPMEALGLAQSHYWMGEADETLIIEEQIQFMDEGTTEDDLDIYRLRDFLAKIPEWAATPKQALPLASLRRLALDLAGTDAGEVAALLLKMQRAIIGVWSPNPLEENMETVEVAGEFIWAQGDDCGRIYDDAMNDVYNSGESTEDFGTAYLNPYPAPIKEWMRSAEKTFRLPS